LITGPGPGLPPGFPGTSRGHQGRDPSAFVNCPVVGRVEQGQILLPSGWREAVQMILEKVPKSVRVGTLSEPLNGVGPQDTGNLAKLGLIELDGPAGDAAF